MRIEAFCYQKLFLRRKKRTLREEENIQNWNCWRGWGAEEDEENLCHLRMVRRYGVLEGERKKEQQAEKQGDFSRKKVYTYIPTIIDKTELPATRSEREEGEKNQKVNNKIENLWFFSFVGCLKGIFFFNFSVLAELRKKVLRFLGRAHSIVQQRRKRRNDY